MVEMGTYNELMSTSASFAHLLEDIHQQEQESAIHIQTQQSIISSVCSEGDDEEVLGVSVDTKQEGSVRWDVYSSYVKAGIGCTVGFLFIVLILTAHQVIYFYSSWWLAIWSDDEGHRYTNMNNCSVNVSRIRSMSDDEWNAYRDRKFYIYCGELDDRT